MLSVAALVMLVAQSAYLGSIPSPDAAVLLPKAVVLATRVVQHARVVGEVVSLVLIKGGRADQALCCGVHAALDGLLGQCAHLVGHRA